MTIRIKPVARPGSRPALALDAGYRPLGDDPLPIRGWQGTVEATLGNSVSEYDKAVRSPSDRQSFLWSPLWPDIQLFPDQAPTRFPINLRDPLQLPRRGACAARNVTFIPSNPGKPPYRSGSSR